ncbi:MAG: hypothetical protein HZA51_05355 [Planctomycetes bacterium]|nr:hypothetical protein [Planctomycetota bacterium]
MYRFFPALLSSGAICLASSLPVNADPYKLYGTLLNGTTGGITAYTFAEISIVDGHVTPLFDFSLPYGIGAMAYDLESCKFVATGALSVDGKVVEIDPVTQTVTPHTVTGLPVGETYVQAIEYNPNEPLGQRMLISFGPSNTNGNDRLAAVNPATGAVIQFTGHLTYDLDGLAYSSLTSEFIIADTNNVPFTSISSIFASPTFTTWANAPNDAEYWEPACDGTGKMYFSKRDTRDLWYIIKTPVGPASYVFVGPHLAPTSSAWAVGLAFGTIPVCVPPPMNMVAWWPLDELAGGTSEDIIAGHNGTHVNAPVPLAGQYVDNALCFDGISSYVNVPDAPGLNFGIGDFSIDAWVKTTVASGVRIVVDKRLESGSTTGYSLYLGNGQLGFQIADGVGGSFCTSCGGGASCTNYGSGVFVATGNWEHVAVTVSRTNNGGTFYVNGAPVGVFNPGCHPNSITNTNPLRIGSRSSSVSAVFDGCIDEVELFNRVLNPVEVASLYNARHAGKCKCRCLGDMNGDSVLNGKDIAPFIRCLLNNSLPTDNCLCADIDGNYSVNYSDVAPFVTSLLVKQPCP